MYTVANHVPMVANLFVLPILTPYLSPKDYGIYGLLMGYIGALGSFGDLGMIVLFQNSFFKEKEKYKELWGKYLGIAIPWQFIFGALSTVVLWLFFRNKVEPEHLSEVLFLVIFPNLFMFVCKGIGLRLCQFENQHKVVYRISIITGLLTVGITFYTIYFLRMGYRGWIISSFAANMIQIVYFAHLIYVKKGIRPNFSISWSFIKESLKISLPIIPHSYSNYLLTTSDRLVADWYKVPLDTIGQYNIAYNLSNYLNSFNDAMNTVITPIYFRLFAKKDDSAKYVIKNLTFLWLSGLLVVQLILCLWIKELVMLVYRNPDLHGSYKYAIFLIMGLSFKPMYNASVDRAIFNGKTLAIQQISVVSGILNVILNLSLVPFFGIEAAIFSTFICYQYKGLAGYFIPSIKKYIELNYYPIPIFLITVGLGVFAYYAVEFHFVYKVGITVVVLAAAVAGYLLKGKTMIQYLNQIKAE